MNKSVAIANLNTKIKAKVGLINKVEHASVHEDMINEVYNNAIVDTDSLATHTSVNDPVNFGYKLILKKVGNVVFFNGEIFKKNFNTNLVIPIITITNLDFRPLSTNEFYFTCLTNNASPTLASVNGDKIQFTVISGSLKFNGQYVTNNL